MPMAAAQSSTSRGSVISGYPSAVSGIEAFMDSFGAVLTAAIVEAETFSRLNLRKAASALPGWRDIADDLDVVYDGEGFALIVNGEESQNKARVLEYGDETTPPSAFLRKTAMAQARVLGTLVGSTLSRMVPSA